MLEYHSIEIEAVKIMYDKYYNNDNISLVRIVRDLEELGYKARKGKNFRTTLVLNILRNPIYVIADQTLSMKSNAFMQVKVMKNIQSQKKAIQTERLKKR